MDIFRAMMEWTSWDKGNTETETSKTSFTRYIMYIIHFHVTKRKKNTLQVQINKNMTQASISDTQETDAIQ